MRWGFPLLASLAVLLSAFATFAAEAGPNREETLTLQQRLTDAGCYHGAIDGAPSATLDAAIKACPNQAPFLRIEAGMHIAPIYAISLSADQKLAVTGSNDKTVRVWSIPDGRLQRTLRMPIDSGNGGKINAVALSPDGATVAAGGSDAAYSVEGKHYVTLFDLRTGAILRRLGPLPNIINVLRFSPDGGRLVAGLGRGGVRVWDAKNWSLALSDPAYRDQVHGADFSADGGLGIASYDGFMRLYDANLRLRAKFAGPGGRNAESISFSRDGREIAVGYFDSDVVDVFAAGILKRLFSSDAGGSRTGNLSRVLWSSDGTTLFAGGQYQTADNLPVLAWAEQGRGGRVVATSAPRNTILDLRPYGRDGFAFASYTPEFGLVDDAGHLVLFKQPVTVDLSGGARFDSRGTNFTVSGDGREVRFVLWQNGFDAWKFDVGAFDLAAAPTQPAGLHAAKVDGLAVTGWADDFAPKLNGALLAIQPHEAAHSLAVLPDSSGLVLGTEWWLRRFDATGRLVWKMPSPGAVWGVNLSSDGRIVIAACGDGTIRWHRASDGAELLALFVDAQDKRWVAWTPSGYYAASPGGEDLIGWHLNRGWTQEADFFPASRFSARFNRPDIVQLVLKTDDEAEAIREANETAKRKQDDAPIAAALPPVVTIVSPQTGASFSGDTVEVAVAVRSPSGLAVDRVDALIDGRPIEARGVAPGQSGPTRKLTIPVPRRNIEISVIARSGELVSEAARVRLAYAGAARVAEDAMKPKLYAVAIGVGDYADETLRLTYPAADARAFADVLQKQKGGLYSDVEVRTILDKDATRANVLDALDWLDTAVTSRDIGMVLIAGHGLTDEKGHYWFLPADAAPKRLGRPRSAKRTSAAT